MFIVLPKNPTIDEIRAFKYMKSRNVLHRKMEKNIPLKCTEKFRNLGQEFKNRKFRKK